MAQITLASIADAVITTDPQGLVIFLNPVACRLTGWSSDEAVGRPLKEVFRTVQGASRRTDDLPIAKVVGDGEVISRTTKWCSSPGMGRRDPSSTMPPPSGTRTARSRVWSSSSGISLSAIGPSRRRGKARSGSANWRTTSAMCSGFTNSTAPRLATSARPMSRSGADLASPFTSGRCLTLKPSTPRTVREQCRLIKARTGQGDGRRIPHRAPRRDNPMGLGPGLPDQG